MIVLWHDIVRFVWQILNFEQIHIFCQPNIIAQPVTLRKKFKKMCFKKALYNFHKEYAVNKKKNN